MNEFVLTLLPSGAKFPLRDQNQVTQKINDIIWSMPIGTSFLVERIQLDYMNSVDLLIDEINHNQIKINFID